MDEQVNHLTSLGTLRSRVRKEEDGVKVMD